MGHPCKLQWVSHLSSVTARHSSSGRQPNCGVEQRAPPVFGRATITLGIGPHSIFLLSFPLIFDFITSAKEVLFLMCLSVCLLATLCRNFQIDLQETFRVGWQWASQQMIRGLFSGFITVGRYGKWLTDINQLLHLEPICQMAGQMLRHW